jgi:hypothetical protein
MIFQKSWPIFRAGCNTIRQRRMSRLLLLSILLVLRVSWACDDDDEEEQLADVREDSEDYYAYAYGFTPETWRAFYQQPAARARVPGDSNKVK